MSYKDLVIINNEKVFKENNNSAHENHVRVRLHMFEYNPATLRKYYTIFLPLWGLWCRGLRFFIVRLSVCLFVCLFVVCLSRSDLIQNWTCKSASSEGTLDFLNKKRFRFRTRADKSIQWRRLRHSRCCWWVITRFESRLHHRTQRGHPCPAGVI